MQFKKRYRPSVSRSTARFWNCKDEPSLFFIIAEMQVKSGKIAYLENVHVRRMCDGGHLGGQTFSPDKLDGGCADVHHESVDELNIVPRFETRFYLSRNFTIPK